MCSESKVGSWFFPEVLVIIALFLPASLPGAFIRKARLCNTLTLLGTPMHVTHIWAPYCA
jgi:hypothetical protein